MAAEDPSIRSDESTSRSDKSPAGVCTEAVYSLMRASMARGLLDPAVGALAWSVIETSPRPWRDQSIGMVKALRTPEADGRTSRRTYVELLTIEWSPAKRGSTLLGRGRKPLHEMCHRGEDCRVLLKKPFSHTPWGPRPVICRQPHKPAETRRERPQAVNRRLMENHFALLTV
jgi:hypothetical protein